MNTKKIIRVSEYYSSLIPLEGDERFSLEELKILEEEFSKYITITSRHPDIQLIETYEYVGYIILPNHIISITPKIPQTSFINMLRYATGLVKIIPDYFELPEETNFYDIIVLFFLQELEKLLLRGLNTGYTVFDDNLSWIRGKILFKEHLSHNYNRNDKIFCSYSDLTLDILENRIIKYTLSRLSQGNFLDRIIDTKIMHYYNRLEQISLTPNSYETFKKIEYTPLNEHYRPILTLCELLLGDLSIDEEIHGNKNVLSFLVDMNLLFEKFVVSLFEERIKNIKISVQDQKGTYADITKTLSLKLDILISYEKRPILILDTKYKKFEFAPETSHVAQLVLYSNSTGVKECCLIYTGKENGLIQTYILHHNIKLHILSFDLKASNRYEFEDKCNDFIASINLLVQSIIEKEKEK